MRLPLARLSLALVLLAGACGGGDDGPGPAGEPAAPPGLPAGELAAAVASYDLAVGPPARFIVGVFNQEKGPVGYGTAHLEFAFLGERQASGPPAPGPTAEASYIPIPGSPPAPEDATRAIYLPALERGVYATEVAFDRAGFWSVEVALDLDGRRQTASTAFSVLPEHEVPFPGDAAPRTENLTVHTPGAQPHAIDSRARDGRPVPNPEIHDTTVAAALDAGRPVVLVISTPTYCVSQFCGPITDMIAELAGLYHDRASFIHIEVWQDFEARSMNDAAQEWIAQGQNTNEPWVFLIAGDGRIAARWDNVASRVEIEPLLQELPSIGA